MNFIEERMLRDGIAIACAAVREFGVAEVESVDPEAGEIVSREQA